MNAQQATVIVALIFIAAGLPRKMSFSIGIGFMIIAIAYNVLHGPAFI